MSSSLSELASPLRAELLFQDEPLQVQALMTAAPVTISPTTSVHEAHTLMQQRQVRHLPVLEHGRLLGMVTDRDIRLALPSPATSLAVHEIHYLLDKLTAAEVMHPFVKTVTPDTPVATAIGYMLGGKISALPVIEQGQLVGILTRTDILRAILRAEAEWCAAA